MDAESGHYNAKGPWKEAERHHKAWEGHIPNLKPFVRSMSGWTMRLLGGRPDEAWLRAHHPLRNIELA
jgi:hypothetical protein